MGTVLKTILFCKNNNILYDYDMPRPPRMLLSKSFYHVMSRGNNRHVVFHQPSDYQMYFSLIARFKVIHPFDLYHYCLMPNHTHFLIQTLDAHEFATFMKKLNLSYYHYYNKKYGWVGHFWQGRYKSQPVGKDQYFLQCGKYIELNPVRGHLVINPSDYAYSSYNFYAHGQDMPLLTEDPLYTTLEFTVLERQQKYRNIIISDIIKGSYNEKIWGSASQNHNEQQKIRYHSS